MELTLKSISTLLVVSLLAACSSSGQLADTKKQSQNPDKPLNVVVILTDDQGYGDLSSYGHPNILTPNIDKMAREGQRWTNFYSVAPLCTPSRAGFLTGKLPIRMGMASNSKGVLYPGDKGGLPQNELTLAEIFKSNGYKTAMFGKWHLGDQPEHLPHQHGFDNWYGIPYSNDMNRDKELVNKVNGHTKNWHLGKAWDEPKPEYWQVPLMHNDTVLEVAPDQSRLTQNYTKGAVEFIEKNKNQPFFLYLAHSMPHVPLFPSEAFKGKSRAGLYGDVIQEIDWSVGQIRKTLEKHGLDENTLVLFTSDNGPWKQFQIQGGSSGHVRGTKTEVFEGGMRVPAVFWSPELVKPSTILDIGSGLDILPTLLSLAGLPAPHDIDGYDLSDTLTELEPSARETLYYYRSERLQAIRHGQYKAQWIVQYGYPDYSVQVLDKPRLYDLNTDIRELYDIADKHPELMAKFEALREAHLATVKPVVNQLNQ